MVSLCACVRGVGAQSFARAAQKDAPASAHEVTVADVDKGFRGEYRLRKTDEKSSVFAFRKILRGRHFDLLHRPNTAGTARLGVIVAKRFVRSAVNRNLIRRIVRESFRLSRMWLPQSDIVVRVSVRMENLDRQALHDEIEKLFARLQ